MRQGQSETSKLEADYAMVKDEINKAYLRYSAEGMPEIYLEMIEAFLNEKEVRIHSLHLAQKSQSATGLARAAHALKGSFLTLEIASIVSLLLEIERQTLSPGIDWHVCQEMIAQVEKAIQDFSRAALKIGKKSDFCK